MKKMLLLLWSSALVAAPELSYYKLKLLSWFAPQELTKKLNKVLTQDYETLYQRKYADENKLLCAKTDLKLDTKINHAHEELIHAFGLDAEERAQFALLQQRIQHSKGTSTKVNTTNHPNFDPSVNEAIERNKTLLGITLDIHTKPRENNFWEMLQGTKKSAAATLNEYEDKNAYGIIMYPNNHFKSSQNLNSIDYTIAHELTHIKFHDFILGLKFLKLAVDHSPQAPESILQKINAILSFHIELRADSHAAVRSPEIAQQYEVAYYNRLSTALRPWNLLTSMAFEDVYEQELSNNHPTKGTPCSFVVSKHPSHLLRYINAIKIRKLLDAKHRWFKTIAADEKYGTIYYERAHDCAFHESSK